MARRLAVACVVVLFWACLQAVAQQGSEYSLTGNLQEVQASVVTSKGEASTTFFGALGFMVLVSEKGDTTVTLDTLNLVSKGVPTGNGDSGLISMWLAAPGYKVSYDPKSQQLSSEFDVYLHYELIDQLLGYRKGESKGEMDLNPSYTERMTGKLTGRLAEALSPSEKGTVFLDDEITFELSSSVLGELREVRTRYRINLDWRRWLLSPARTLRIQPVFIGSGPSDSTATGTAFNTLMSRALELWNRCGSVRCLTFEVNAPRYINDSAYKVLDTEAEITSLRGLENVTDAIEVYVVQRMVDGLTCSTGGGACYGSGASAKVVTSDQQLAVPCPCACTSYCPCGSCVCGPVNYYHLAHELGHALNLDHPNGAYGLAPSTASSNMEPSGFCCDNPNVQSAQNCRNATNPLLYWSWASCRGSPDIMD